jgi:hypothetical protein
MRSTPAMITGHHQDVHDGGTGLDALGVLEDARCQLQEIDIEADFALPVWDHRVAIVFLYFARQMRFRQPGGAETQCVGCFDLFEKVAEHLPFTRQLTVCRCLADGEEDVEVHPSPQMLRMRPPSAAMLCPRM